MPRKKAPLTRAEVRIMNVLWERGSATISDIVAALPSPPLAYNTVLTIVRILERKGHVRHREAGRAFVYRAAIARDEAARTAVGELLSRFFRNSPGELALRLVEDEQLSAQELERLRSLIDKHENKDWLNE